MALPDPPSALGPIPPAVRAPGSAAYAWFAVAVASWFLGSGMQTVLFPWLVVGELGSSAEVLGLAQLALVLPNFAFLLIGGATADRTDRRGLLMLLHAVAAALVLALAFVVATGRLGLPPLIVFALLMGAITAFVFPTRDALLSAVAGANLMRAVTGATLVQFAGSALGTAIAGSARFVGSAAALGIMAALILVGVVAVRRLPRDDAHVLDSPAPLRAGELLGGAAEVLRSKVLRPIFLLTMGIGFFLMGPYFVAYPIVVRDFYQGDVALLGLLTGTFPAGVMLGALVLLRRGYLHRKGLAQVLAQSGAGLCLIALSFGLPYPLALVAGLGWGVCGSVFITAGRTAFQEHASEVNRARVLSVYSLGFVGAASIGAPLAGVLTGWLGPLGTFRFCGVAMLAFVGLIVLTTPVLRLR